jgi:hypothetical protein
MKRKLLVAASLISVSVFADGTINFSNRNIPVRSGDGFYHVPIWADDHDANPSTHGPGAGLLPGGVTVGLFKYTESRGFVLLASTTLRTDTSANAAFFGGAGPTA